MTETDLYAPVQKYFAQLGYTIDAEVKDLDVLCIREEQSVVIELKNELNLKVITQSALRQKMFDWVYVAIWTPKNMRQQAFKDKVYLLKRLGIGLILVSPHALSVDIYHEPMIHPIEEYQRRNRKKKKKIIEELKKRRTHMNIGGTHRKKIITAYKEDALIILDYLKKHESMPLSQITQDTQIKRTGTIVQKNFYGWFKRVQRGVYALTDVGLDAHEEYTHVIAKIRNADQ